MSKIGSGGFRVGAGRPGRDIKVHDCLRLSVPTLKKNGVFAAPWEGPWGWTDGQTGKIFSVVQLKTTPRFIHLSFGSRGKAVSQAVSLARIPNTYGGERIYFSCPRCACRRRELYLLNGLFLCRVCQDLPYQSQSEGVIERLSRAQRKIEKRICSRYQKPKGMHFSTFKNLRSEWLRLEYQREDLVEGLFDFLRTRL